MPWSTNATDGRSEVEASDQDPELLFSEDIGHPLLPESSDFAFEGLPTDTYTGSQYEDQQSSWDAIDWLSFDDLASAGQETVASNDVLRQTSWDGDSYLTFGRDSVTTAPAGISIMPQLLTSTSPSYASVAESIPYQSSQHWPCLASSQNSVLPTGARDASQVADSSLLFVPPLRPSISSYNYDPLRCNGRPGRASLDPCVSNSPEPCVTQSARSKRTASRSVAPQIRDRYHCPICGVEVERKADFKRHLSMHAGTDGARSPEAEALLLTLHCKALHHRLMWSCGFCWHACLSAEQWVDHVEAHMQTHDAVSTKRWAIENQVLGILTTNFSNAELVDAMASDDKQAELSDMSVVLEALQLASLPTAALSTITSVLKTRGITADIIQACNSENISARYGHGPTEQPRRKKAQTAAFKCHECGSTYNREVDLHKHQRIHRPRTFACEHCNYRFSYAKDLARHQHSRHAKDKQISCKHCEKSFTRKDNLIRHTNIQHPGASWQT